MKEISLKELLEAGCHFGHQTTRWNPKMKPYIFTTRDRIHIFDLVKTKGGLEAAASFVKSEVSLGEQIIFVGTKRQAQEICQAAAQKVNMPYMTRKWIAGLITNWEQIKKRLSYLKQLKEDKASGKYKEWTKKENLMIDREITKLELGFGGIVGLKSVPKAVFVLDAKKDFSVLKEAKARGVKTIAIVDTNTNPDLVDYPIPANDDAVKSIQLIVDYITGAVEEGLNQIKNEKTCPEHVEGLKIKNDEEKEKVVVESEEKEKEKAVNSEKKEAQKSENKEIKKKRTSKKEKTVKEEVKIA